MNTSTKGHTPTHTQMKITLLARIAALTAIGAAVDATGEPACFLTACCRSAALYGLTLEQWAAMPAAA